jgi:hypothetical protein
MKALFPRLVILVAAGAVALGAADEPRLRVEHGPLKRELRQADLARLPTARAEVTEQGRAVVYEGVLVRDVLALVDAPLGERLRGPAVALAVRVVAEDGYVAAFALAEFDAAFRARPILLAFARDGAELTASAGPWRLLCPGDTRGARGIRQVTRLEILSLAVDAGAR